MEQIPEKLEGMGIGDEQQVNSQSAELVARKAANATPSLQSAKTWRLNLATP